MLQNKWLFILNAMHIYWPLLKLSAELHYDPVITFRCAAVLKASRVRIPHRCWRCICRSLKNPHLSIHVLS